ncbi:response regulator [Evansella sp. AB-rgal1]|uniref:response regulator transcription factor n=1 Tax=Evansella sp. AB-rgal1 TaxID=3242696 RepID=UPI00359E5CB2
MVDHTKVLIVEDDKLLLTGLKMLIDSEEDMTVVATAENGHDAYLLMEQEQPDLVLMDIRMPIVNGIECTKKIRKKFPNVVILIHTTFNEEEYIIEALANGAHGYLIKGMNVSKLVQTIRDAMNGEYLLPSEVAMKLANYIFHKKYDKNHQLSAIISTIPFTKREEEIAYLLARRLSNNEIAKELFVSEGTIKNYLTNIYEKLGVKNRREAIEFLK